MAELSITNDRVTVTLTWWEKLASGRSHFALPLRTITAVEPVDSVVAAVAYERTKGRRVQATRIPGMTTTGVYAHDAEQTTTFLVCHREGPGIILDLMGATVDRIIVSTPKAQTYARALRKRLM